MTDDHSFLELMSRVRAGERDAAAEMIREFEPELRREVRARMTRRHLRRVVDSTDICQSVFGNFFLRLSLGQFDLARPQDLVRLLATMARNKVIDKHRREQHRGGDTLLSLEVLLKEPESSDDRPVDVVIQNDLIVEVQSRMTAEEREISERRQLGQSWDTISEAMNSGSEALRKRLTRALDRISNELSLE